MVSASPISFRYRRCVALCAVVILCGLAAHLTVDAIRETSDLVGLRARGRFAADQRVAACDLLGEIALPAVEVTLNLPLLAFLVKDPGLILLSWVLPPPVRPPMAIR